MEGFNQNDYRMTYNVDIALCIDVTGSMRPCAMISKIR